MNVLWVLALMYFTYGFSVYIFCIGKVKEGTVCYTFAIYVLVYRRELWTAVMYIGFSVMDFVFGFLVRAFSIGKI